MRKVIALQVTLPWSILDAQYFCLGDISPTSHFYRVKHPIALLKGNVNYLRLTFVSKGLSHFAIHPSGLNLFSDIVTILS